MSDLLADSGVGAEPLLRSVVIDQLTAKIRNGVETALTDYRDVLMNEYDERIDYKGELSRLGLDRPYPV